MASAPQPTLPMLYKDLMPLNSRDHGTWRSRPLEKAAWLSGQHAIPLTTDEFFQAQRHFPIVFSSGENPVPLALMGLNEGINVFFDDDGKAREEVYIPAYLRRYPYLLARLDPNAETMSLCFDPTAEVIGDFEQGEPLFEGEKPTPLVDEILQFCQNFEEAGQRTAAFMAELQKADLLMEGEVAIQQNDKPDQPYIYRGFQMVNQEKMRDLRGDQLRKMNENSALPLIFAHLFSLDMMRIIFSKQTQQGKGPGAEQAAQAPAPVNA